MEFPRTLLRVLFLATLLWTSTGKSAARNGRKLLQMAELGSEVSPLNESEDTREAVSDSSQIPYNMIGPIISVLSDQSRLGCTGALIDSLFVLTAAHCLFDTASQETVEASTFAPGYNSQQEPAAPAGIANGVSFRVPQGFLNCGDGYTDCHRQYDYGVMMIDTTFDNYFQYSSKSDESNTAINTAGYPGDKDNCFDFSQNSPCVPYHVSCNDNFIQDGDSYVNSNCYTSKGQSGSPLWEYYLDTQTRLVRGVLAAGEIGGGAGSFTLITEDVQTQIQQFIDEMSS